MMSKRICVCYLVVRMNDDICKQKTCSPEILTGREEDNQLVVLLNINPKRGQTHLYYPPFKQSSPTYFF